MITRYFIDPIIFMFNDFVMEMIGFYNIYLAEILFIYLIKRDKFFVHYLHDIIQIYSKY